jgi:hypothetical protein
MISLRGNDDRNLGLLRKRRIFGAGNSDHRCSCFTGFVEKTRDFHASATARDCDDGCLFQKGSETQEIAQFSQADVCVGRTQERVNTESSMPTAADPGQINHVRLMDGGGSRPERRGSPLAEMRKGGLQFFWLAKDILEKVGHGAL